MMHGEFKFKFFSREKYVIKNIREWNWPFLDIFLYQEVGNGTGTVIANPKDQPVKFQHEDLLPTQKVDFMGLSLPAPRYQIYKESECQNVLIFSLLYVEITLPCFLYNRNIELVIRKEYGESALTHCKSGYYNHRWEVFSQTEEVEIECYKLEHLYKIGWRKMFDSTL